MQKSTSPVDYIFIYKYLFGPTAMTVFICFIWFVAYYTGVSPRRFLLAMSLWIAVTIALHVLLPFGILYTDISGLREIMLPWGEQIVSARGSPNPLRVTFDLFNLVLFCFCFYALVRQYRDGQRRRALAYGVGAAPRGCVDNQQRRERRWSNAGRCVGGERSGGWVSER